MTPPPTAPEPFSASASDDVNLLETLPPETLSTLGASHALGETWVVEPEGARARSLAATVASPAGDAAPSAPPRRSGAEAAGAEASLSRSFGRSMFSDGDAPAPGETALGSRFDVQQPLGVGTYGEVWRARDLDLSRAVALKRFKGDRHLALGACRDELRFVGRLEHPGVPPVYQAGLTEEGQPYVVMKLLEGEPLSALIARLKEGDLLTHASFPFSRRVELILQLLRVVGAAHAARVLHRDIKPDNIYVGRFGEVSLIDWGIAEDFDVAREQPRVCGTPLYLSPEQGLGRPLGPESDLYAVGAVAYELLGLESAAPKGETVLEILHALPTHQPVQLDMLYSPHQGTPSIQYLKPVMRAIARDPKDRFHSAEEMSRALQRSLEGHCDVGCPRSLLKSVALRFSRWLDERRLANTLITYAALIGVVYGLMRLGGALGL